MAVACLLRVRMPAICCDLHNSVQLGNFNCKQLECLTCSCGSTVTDLRVACFHVRVSGRLVWHSWAWDHVDDV